MRSARGGIVLGWFFKIIVMLAILAMVSFEVGAIVVSKVTADRVAIDAASEAGQVLSQTGSMSKARDAAEQIVTKEQANLIDLHLVDSGRFVQVTVRKKASTFIVQHIGFLKKYGIADSTHTGAVR